MKKWILCLLVLLIVPVLASDAPVWTGYYVNDYAGILGNSPELESMLTELENNSTVEFAIVTLAALPSDETMETYSNKIFNSWGIGKKDQDNGLLLLMIFNGTPGSRIRLEVGRGLEGDINDAKAGRILDDSLPYYSSGDYSQAAYVVLSEVSGILSGNYIPPEINSQYYDIITESVFILLTLLPFILFILAIVSLQLSRQKCPKCGSRDVNCDENICQCNRCGKRFKKKKKSNFFFFAAPGGSWGSGGGGFGGGGFGGGSSGGGGAGR
jgi:uncharacterized protein